MQNPLDVLVSQLLALSLPIGAAVYIAARRRFQVRYRLGLLFILILASGLEFVFLAAYAEFSESRTEWALKQRGITAMARIVSSSEAGMYSRRPGKGHLNWSHYFDAVCEYADDRGVVRRGEVELTDSMPHRRGDPVAVRYLPANPEIVREAYYANAAKEPPSKLAFASIPWVANVLVAALIYGDIRRRRRTATRMGLSNWPFNE